jgi:hypothetical protein
MTRQASHRKNHFEEGDQAQIELGSIGILASSTSSLKQKNYGKKVLSAQERDHYKNLGTESGEIQAVLKKKETQHRKTVEIEDESSFGKEDCRACFSLVLKRFIIPIRGYVLMIVGAFLFTFANTLIRKTKWLSASDHLFIRYVLGFIILSIYIKHKKMEIFPKGNLKLLFLRGFLGKYNFLKIILQCLKAFPSKL